MAVYIALGANQDAEYEGKRLCPKATFKHVLGDFTQDNMNVCNVSHIWQSPAWPDPNAQPAYKNAVFSLSASHNPLELLKYIKTLERKYGRVSGERNAPRPLDLDILDMNGQIYRGPNLTLPHPRMVTRGFVLLPLAEIAPHWRDPQKNRAIHDWIARLPLSDIEPMKRLGPII